MTKIPVSLTPRKAKALDDLLEQQIAFEDAPEPSPSPSPPPPPRTADGAVVYQITCRLAVKATMDNDPAPLCSWVREFEGFRSGFRCVVEGCDKYVGPDEVRAQFLNALVPE